MKKEDLFEAIGDIDDDLVSHAEDFSVTGTKFTWRQMTLAVACVIVMVSAVVPFAVAAVQGRPWISVLLPWQEKGSDHPDDPDALPLYSSKEPYLENIIIYNRAYYSYLDMSNRENLDKLNLPHEIRETDLRGIVGEAETDQGKPVKLYEYMSGQQAVYIAECEGKYAFAVFCNRIRKDLYPCDTAQELFAIYGIHGAEEIACIEIGDRKLTSGGEIEKFYSALCSAQAMGNDEWNAVVFNGMSEKESNRLCITLADTAQEISVTSTAGIRANGLTYYPTIQYVEWAINYYRLKESIK